LCATVMYLLSSLPDIFLMCSAVVQVHAVLEALGEVFLGPRLWILDVEIIGKGAQPVHHLIAVLQCLLLGDYVFEHNIAIFIELVTPVAIWLLHALALVGVKEGCHCEKCAIML